MTRTTYKDISPGEAVEIQNKLKTKIETKPLQKAPDTVAGADISFDRGSNVVHAAIIVLSFSGLEPVARSLVTSVMSFPYIPGLLAFREMPVLLKAWDLLPQKPDVLIMDGHGLAHPRRMGIATHFGIEVDHPTMGCAKNILIGTHQEVGMEKGATSDLLDEGEKVGLVLRSRANVNPIYISPGHKCSSKDTYEILMKVLTKYKLPQTTRLAHRWANKLRKGDVESGYFEF